MSSPVRKVTESTASPVRVSVIVPVRNGAHHLRRTLPVLRDNLPADWEILVVDDNSTDGSPEVARLYADQVIPNPCGKSAPAARNAGTRSARGSILVFLDADVRVNRQGLTNLVKALEAPGVACTFGIYSEGRYLETLGGRFKNIWVRYSYLQSPTRVRWMNTAMAAIRRDDFMAIGGYGSQDDWLEGGNDMDFGRRVDEKLGRVLLLHDVDCDHLKELSLVGLLKNDFYRTRGFFRTAFLSREIRRAPRQGYGNVSPGFIGGVLSAQAFVLGLVLAPGSPAFLGLAGGALLAHGLLGSGFYRYAMPRLGRWAPMAPPILLIDHLACALGLVCEAASLTRLKLAGARPASPLPESEVEQPQTDVRPAANV